MPSLNLPILCALLVSLAACQSSDVPAPGTAPAEAASPPASGQFDVTLSGEIRDRFSGVAAFHVTTDEDTGQPAYFLVMNEDPDRDDSRTLVVTGHGRPAVGEHPVLDVEAMMAAGTEDVPAGHVSVQVQGPGRYLLSPGGGTLRITEASASRLVGTIDFRAVGMHIAGDPPRTPVRDVRVEGRFTATLVAEAP